MQYISVANQQAVDRVYRPTVLIVAVFCVTPILLMLIGKFALHPHFTGDLAGYVKVKNMAYGGTIMLGLLAVGLRRIGHLTLSGRGRKQAAEPVLNRLRLLSIGGAALGEVIGLVGLLAYWLTGDYEFCWRLGVVSLLLILYSLPRRWEWERLVTANTED